jgi:two-component sensor histidine kinase
VEEVPMKEKRKELQDALKRLESCCPSGLSDSVQQTLTSELREALFDLDRARSREQQLREESDALLEGMNLIISSESTRKAFKAVLEVLKRLMSFDDAFVLREQNNSCLYAVASTSPLYEKLVWQPGAMFKRVLAGNSVNVRDISNSTDWQGQPPEIHRNVASALHTPFNTNRERAVLVCTSIQESFFNKTSIQFLERFSPLAGQALYNLEINDLLRDEMRDRKEAEDALREAHDELELRVEQRTAELQASNVSLQREIEEKKRAEEEKAVLLREVQHRAKNNMQVISSLLNLQSSQIEDRHYSDMFIASNNRIRSMSLVYDQLQRSRELVNIDFHDYISMLVKGLLSLYKEVANRVSIKIDIKDIVLGIDTSIPCGLIVNEVLTNCLQHAFPEGRTGKITIALGKSEADGEPMYDLTVSDTGIGMAADTDIKEGSLGLRLVSTLVEHQLHGSLEVSRKGGTCYHIRFNEIAYTKRM